MRGGISPKSLIEELSGRALAETVTGYPPELRIAHAIRDGKPIPDRCKPGAFIASLPQQDRDVLKELKSDDIKHSLPYRQWR